VRNASGAGAVGSARLPRGFLIPRSAGQFADRVGAFREGLKELGYVEGKNLVIEWRYADGEYARLPVLADELARAQVDVLVVDSTPGVRAARAATRTIPIVMLSVGDPVASGIVASLSRPGANVTGLSNLVGDVSAKYVELLQLAVPGLSRVAVLTNPDNFTHPPIIERIKNIAERLTLRVLPVTARTPDDIRAVFRDSR